MRIRLLFGFSFLIFVFGCNQKKADTASNASEIQEIKGDSIKSKLIEKIEFDIDGNGQKEVIVLKEFLDLDTLEVEFNGQNKSFVSISTVYDSVRNKNFIERSQVESPYLIIFKTLKHKNFVFLNERPDFAGPTNLVFGFKNGEFELLFDNQAEQIELLDVDSLNTTYLVLKELVHEPGFKENYTYVSYPKFELYKISDESVEYDSLMSIEYNLEHNKNFVEYLKMKNPVVGMREGERTPRLFDLDTINQNNNSVITGRWKLIEVYSDPGDGSGDFSSVTSEKLLIINSDNTIESNRDLCHIWSSEETKSTASYSLVNSTIVPNNCNSEKEWHFELEEENLIIRYVCKEGCAEMYKKLQ